MKKLSRLDRFTGKAPLTLELVDDFAELTRAEHLEILHLLRARSIQDNYELPLYGIILPIVITVSVGLSDIKPIVGSGLAAGIAIGLVGLVVAVPLALIIGIPVVLREMRRRKDVGLLAAYEDELVRRRGMSGRRGRRWRDAH